MTAVLAGRRDVVEDLAAALEDLRRGRPLLVTDDSGEQHMVIAAERVTGPAMALLVRHSSGFVCVAVEGERLAALDIPLMTADDPGREAFAVSVDAVAGLTTGISAHERARTARALADPASTSVDLVRPGHVMPLRVRPGGVLERPAVPEAAADLCRLAGLVPAAVFAALVESATDPALLDLAAVRVADVVRHRERVESPVQHTATAPLANRHGVFQEHAYLDVRSGAEHLAVVAGDVTGAHAVLVRVHAECPAGDLLGSVGCTCAGDLDAGLSAIGAADRGVLVYLRRSGPERGHGSSGPGSPEPARDQRVTAHVLADLGLRSVLLLTDDPQQADELADLGVPVLRCVPLGATSSGPVGTGPGGRR
jgi:3,4-dihydroxy 2-butanone 4-phosphate synthase/GTP cyclohydrolase II